MSAAADERWLSGKIRCVRAPDLLDASRPAGAGGEDRTPDRRSAPRRWTVDRGDRPSPTADGMIQPPRSERS